MKTIDSKILVKKVEEDGVEDYTEKVGNLVIPNRNKQTEKYEVISVGEKITSLKEGDVVVTFPNPGTIVKHDGVDYRVISIPDILIVL